MAEPRESFRGLVLSAIEIRELTDWPEAMVEDYLSILDSLIILSESIEGGDNSIQLQIDAINTQLTTINLEIDAIDAELIAIKLRLDALEALIPNLITTTIDYTAITGENLVIICLNTLAITVTLPSSPKDEQTVTVKRAGSKVTLDANGKTIDGSATAAMTEKYMSLQLVYSLSANVWSIV